MIENICKRSSGIFIWVSITQNTIPDVRAIKCVNVQDVEIRVVHGKNSFNIRDKDSFPFALDVWMGGLIMIISQVIPSELLCYVWPNRRM